MTLQKSWKRCVHAFTSYFPRMCLGRIMVFYTQWALVLFCVAWGTTVHSGELDEVLKAGKLRHLGIPYANFVNNQGVGGLDVELMQRFSAYLKVDYEYVQSSWDTIIADLTGKRVRQQGDEVVVTETSEVLGDVIATGFTVLPWRTKIVDFATVSFPTGIWLITRADSDLQPVTPSGSIQKDIEYVKAELRNHSILALENSCLDPGLYQLEKTAGDIQLLPPERDLDEMIPLVIARTVDSTLMDVPAALIALKRWTGQIKVMGPISQQQEMAPAFAKSTPRLREAFEAFFKDLKADGTYKEMVERYYSTVFTYYPDFLE